MLAVETLTSVCSNTIGRNFIVPYLISISPKACHSMGMQGLIQLKVQTEDISYSALNVVTVFRGDGEIAWSNNHSL